MLAAPAAACSPPPYYPPPVLPGESDEAYRVRIEAQARRDAEARRSAFETAQRAREDLLWRTAATIVAVEVVSVSPFREGRDGIPYELVTLRRIGTERGRGVPLRLVLKSHETGGMCLAPSGPVYPRKGKLVLFARSGKLSDTAVIDWSNAELSTHPETLALLMRASTPSQ